MRATDALETAGPGPRVRLVAAALLGRLWSDFAEDFTHAAIVPDEVRADEELLRVWIGVAHDQAHAFYASAVDAFKRCERLATEMGGEGMRAWGRHCAAHRRINTARMEGPPEPSDAVAGSWEPDPRAGLPPGPDDCWVSRAAAPAAEPPAPPEAVAVVDAERWHETAPLSPQERTRVVDAVRRQLAEHVEQTVVPEREGARWDRASTRGQAEPGGPRCALEPRRDEVFARRDPTTGLARVSPTCVAADDCRLVVQLPPVTWSADVEGDPLDVRAWTDAAARLTRLEDRERPSIVGIHRPAEDPVELASTTLFGDWGEDAAAEVEDVITGALDTVAGCRPAETDALLRFVLRVSSSGRVGRVLVEPNGGTPGTCATRILRRLRFPSGVGERRIRLVLAWAGPSVEEGDTDVRVWTQASRALRSTLDGPVREVLARCYREAWPADGPTTAWRATLTLDARGTVEEVAVQPLAPDAEGTEAPDAVGACVTEALRGVEFTCPEKERDLSVDVCMAPE